MALSAAISGSTETVMKPHMKNNVVTVAKPPPMPLYLLSSVIGSLGRLWELERCQTATFINAVRVGSRRWLNGRIAAPTAGASSDSAARATGAVDGMVALY